MTISGAFYWNKAEAGIITFQFAKPGPPAVNGNASLPDLNKVVDKIKSNAANILLLTVHTHPFTPNRSQGDKSQSQNYGGRDKSSSVYKWNDTIGIIISPNGNDINIYDSKNERIAENDLRRTKCLNQ